MPAFRVKLGAYDLNCVDMPLNPTHSLTNNNNDDNVMCDIKDIFVVL